jgi:PAS domain S-box-containing protein
MKQKLIDSDIRFRKLIENSFSGVTLLDESFKVIYRSPSAERINGWTTISRMKNTVEDMIHPDDEEVVTKLLRQVLDNANVPQTCIFRTKHFSGHFIWIQCTFTNMFHEPEVNAIVCNFIDISGQKQSEALLQQSIDELSTYKYAIDEADIVAITDQKGVIKHVNDNFCKISKYSREELIGQDHRIINSSYHSKAFIRNLWVTIAGGKIWKGELKNKAKDGSHYWVDTTIIPFLNKEGKPYQYVAIRSDITERKLFQDRIIESERFIKTITDNLPAMVAYWSADLLCLFANKSYLDWFDMPQNEMLGIHKNALMHGFEFEQCKPYIEKVLQGSPQSFERSFFKENGKTIYTHTQYVPDKQGDTVKGFYSLIYDYSEIKDAETELKQLNERFSLISKATNVALFEWDFEKDKIWWSESYFTMFGFDPKQPYPTREEWLLKIQTASQRVIENIVADIHNKGLDNWQDEINYFKPDTTRGTLLSRGVVIRDEHHKAVRIVGSYIDITVQKNEELQKALFAKTSLIFNEHAELAVALKKVLEELVDPGDFSLAEAWLISADKKKIDLVAKYLSNDHIQIFYTENTAIKSFAKGEGLPGTTWQTQAIQFWYDIDKDKNFKRRAAAKKAGLKSAYGLPLTYNGEIIGVLIFGSGSNENRENAFNILKDYSAHLGSEIKRKQLEEELNQVFNFTPDILCIANIDGYFKKVNPAMSDLLEYSEEELLAKPFMGFVHPLDVGATATELQNIADGNPTYYIENRYVTKSGKIKWLAWTTTSASEQGVLYCSAKDITDKKDLEVLLHKATNLARIGGWEMDLVKETVYWSAMTREILEVPPEFQPGPGKGIDFYKEGESRVTISQVIEDAIANGTPWDVELQIITAKGNAKWVRVIGEAEFAENKCIKIIGSFQEIDARKRAEIAATANLEEKNNILESIGDAFFAVDKNWIVTYWNNMAEKAMGKSRSEVLNKNIWEVYPKAVNTEAYIKYHEAFETNQVVHFELHTLYFKKWTEVSIFPTGNGLSIYLKDINERKNAELAATAALEERNTILESIDDAFFAVDKNWTVTYWNSRAEEVLRTPKEAILHHNLWDVFSSSIDSESYKRYHQAVETNQAAHFEDYYEALEKWYEISAYPSESGLSVYFKDITGRRLSEALLTELNENLQKQAKELSISNAELEQFAYVASHDLQEPLRMVTSFLSLLEKKYGEAVDDKGKQYIHFAVDGAKRMRQIILDLLEFSRVGRLEESIEEVDTGKIIGDILPLYRKQIEEQNAAITFDNLPMLQTYKVPARQVFQNLIGNALKYQKPGVRPLIHISCEDLHTHWRFSVKDNGIGIDPEYFDKIFIIFQRLHNKDEYSGTGMGLAVTKKIVENLGGRIWVESEEGAGSVFYFTILKNKL